MDEVIAISVAAIMVRVKKFCWRSRVGGIPETTFPTSLVERKKKAKLQTFPQGLKAIVFVWNGCTQKAVPTGCTG